VLVGVTWTFIWLMLLLKIPIGGLLWIVWWAIHQTEDDPAVGDGGGGSKIPNPHAPRPRRPRPRPRRGAHQVLPPPAPARTRCVAAKIRNPDCPATSRSSGKCGAHASRPGDAPAVAEEGS
jgi:hypothetical protein